MKRSLRKSLVFGGAIVESVVPLEGCVQISWKDALIGSFADGKMDGIMQKWPPLAISSKVHAMYRVVKMVPFGVNSV